jgi:hypothetical protein
MATPDLSAAIESLALALLEKKNGNKQGTYYYDVVGVKRWLPDADACELCEDNADRGWIDQDDVFESVFGDVDEPPAHPHCGCGVEYGEKRKRVYV